MRQRGFGILGYLIAAGALVAALAGLYALVDGRGYARGSSEMQQRWNAANQEADDTQRERERDVSKELAVVDTARQAAEDKASKANLRWQEAKRESDRRGRALAAIESEPRGSGPVASGQSAAPDAAAAVDQPGVRIRTTWEFVRHYDSAWTGAGGEPVFPAAAGYSPTAESGAASPYGLGEVLDVHGENARRCSTDRREFQTVIDRIEAAERAWANKP